MKLKNIRLKAIALLTLMVASTGLSTQAADLSSLAIDVGSGALLGAAAYLGLRDDIEPLEAISIPCGCASACLVLASSYIRMNEATKICEFHIPSNNRMITLISSIAATGFLLYKVGNYLDNLDKRHQLDLL